MMAVKSNISLAEREKSVLEGKIKNRKNKIKY